MKKNTTAPLCIWFIWFNTSMNPFTTGLPSKGELHQEVSCHLTTRALNSRVMVYKSILVGGWPTPLKNMSSSVGMMKFPIYGKIKNDPHHQPVLQHGHFMSFVSFLQKMYQSSLSLVGCSPCLFRDQMFGHKILACLMVISSLCPVQSPKKCW